MRPVLEWGPLTSSPFVPTVLEARVRQLQAECVSEVTVKRVDVARLPEAGGFQPPRKAQPGATGAAPGLSGRWAEKLDKEKWTMQKRRQRLEAKLEEQARKLAREQQLRVEPRLLNGQLAKSLQRWEQGGPHSPWEEPLAQLLQEAPRRLGCEAKQAPADRVAEARLESQRQRLLAFLECCLFTGHLPLAHHVLVVQHSRSRQQRLLTLAMYNTVMLGWARKVSGAWPGPPEEEGVAAACPPCPLEVGAETRDGRTCLRLPASNSST